MGNGGWRMEEEISHVQHLPARPLKPTADLSINTGEIMGDSMSEISVSYLQVQLRCPIDLLYLELGPVLYVYPRKFQGTK